jgi:hypothetical protein
MESIRLGNFLEGLKLKNIFVGICFVDKWNSVEFEMCC